VATPPPFTATALVTEVAERTFTAQLEYLPEAVAFLSACAADHGLPPDRVGEIELVAEEVLVNIIKYAYPEGTGEVRVTCAADEAGQVVMTFTDSGVAFDPLALPPPDTSADVEARQVGGLGVFFVRELSEEVTYERRDHRNHLRLSFGRRAP